MERKWRQEGYEQRGERPPQSFDAQKERSQRAQQDQPFASSSTYGETNQGQLASEADYYDPTAYLPQSAFGTASSYQTSQSEVSRTIPTEEHVRTDNTRGYYPSNEATYGMSYPSMNDVRATYGMPYPSMNDVRATSGGFMEEGNNPYSTYGYGDISTYGYGDMQPAPREARNEASLSSEMGQKRGMTNSNYLEAESQLLATQKADVEAQSARNAHEMQSTSNPAWLDAYRVRHTNEAAWLQRQHQQQREELQTAYGLQDYEKFMANNPGKSAYVYIDTVLNEKTGKSQKQLKTEYQKRGASAHSYIDNILRKKQANHKGSWKTRFQSLKKVKQEIS